MRITSISENPILEIPFLNAGKGAGGFYVDQLPVHMATVEGLPEGLDAIVATADLQGRERCDRNHRGPRRLLGEVLPSRLRDEILPDLGLSPQRTGILLAGDFYTLPGLDKRGGSGDVIEVWRAFGETFKWTVGVAGNHDLFGNDIHPQTSLGSCCHYLDDSCVILDGRRLAGLGGIIGNPKRPHRRTDEEYMFCLESLLERQPEILILHDGPNSPADRLRGSAPIRQALERHGPLLVVRGHAHWRIPLVQLDSGTQVLNVDCRVVVLHSGKKFTNPQVGR